MPRLFRSIFCLAVLALHLSVTFGVADGWVICKHADGAGRIEAPDDQSDCHPAGAVTDTVTAAAADANAEARLGVPPCQDTPLALAPAAATPKAADVHVNAAAALVELPTFLVVHNDATPPARIPAAVALPHDAAVALRTVILVI